MRRQTAGMETAALAAMLAAPRGCQTRSPRHSAARAGADTVCTGTSVCYLLLFSRLLHFNLSFQTPRRPARTRLAAAIQLDLRHVGKIRFNDLWRPPVKNPQLARIGVVHAHASPPSSSTWRCRVCDGG